MTRAPYHTRKPPLAKKPHPLYVHLEVESGRPTVVIQVEPVEIGGKFWIDVTIDDKTERRGPFDNADAAGAMARRLLQIGRTLSGGGSRG
jgi:hypothetical protein